MAREEQPREDLLAEARNLVERVSLRLSTPQFTADESELVAGFRRDGSLAIFFGQQRVYQFTSAGELRRAYIDGLLYKAAAGKLVSMRRARTPDAVHLVRVPLADAAAIAFLERMHEYLQQLAGVLQRHEYTLIGQVPTAGNVIDRVQSWLGTHAGRITIATSPRSS